jgi:hypothetical protein
MSRKVFLGPSVGIGALCLALTGCGSVSRTALAGTNGVPTTSPITSARSTVTAPPASSTTAVPPTRVPAVVTCTVTDLRISLTPPLGSAGALHYQLLFENISGFVCNLSGLPGVSFLDSTGEEIGPPAQEATAASQLVSINPGDTADARLDVTDPSIAPCSGSGSVTLVRVYPPDSYTAVYVMPTFNMEMCNSSNSANYVDSTIGPIASSSSPGYEP